MTYAIFFHVVVLIFLFQRDKSNYIMSRRISLSNDLETDHIYMLIFICFISHDTVMILALIVTFIFSDGLIKFLYSTSKKI